MSDTLNYSLKILCRSIGSNIINQLAYENCKQFNIEVFDFGSYVLLFRHINDPKYFRWVLDELTYPTLGYEIEVFINDQIIKKDHHTEKWKGEIKDIIEEFKDKNVVLVK